MRKVPIKVQWDLSNKLTLLKGELELKDKDQVIRFLISEYEEKQ